jgi:tRNA(fMet)-specific endonuclease VapC
MKYLLDTDHLSILQRKAGAEYLRLANWMAQYTPSDFACLRRTGA